MTGSTALTVAVLGLGEAGSLIGADLVRAGARVRGYDPIAARAQAFAAAHVEAVVTADAAAACEGAGLVLSLNSSADALDALAQGLPGCAPGTIWAEMNTAAPSVKQAVDSAAVGRVRVVDVAVMAPVPPQGLRTPLAASGPAAAVFAELVRPYGARVDIIDGPLGAAATQKLLRSVFYKGLAAAVVEALEAARTAGLEEWLRGNIAGELTAAGSSTVDRLVEGSHRHAVRREHEMAAAAQLLDELGVPARVSRASQEWLHDLASRILSPVPSGAGVTQLLGQGGVLLSDDGT
jgi:3-hydroxyisobutyrate dehydrogenase-like beta-hydroxyacid dehydrogenase